MKKNKSNNWVNFKIFFKLINNNMKKDFMKQKNYSKETRIHIFDLCKYFNKLGHKSKVNPKNIDDFDVIIYGKNYPGKIKKHKLIGKVTPFSDNIKQLKEYSILSSKRHY